MPLWWQRFIMMWGRSIDLGCAMSSGLLFSDPHDDTLSDLEQRYLNNILWSELVRGQWFDAKEYA